MGNELTKKGYAVADEPCGSLGPKGIWSVYSAKHKTTGRDASVLLFDKKRLAAAKLPKATCEAVLAMLRRDIKKLVRCVCYTLCAPLLRRVWSA